MAVRLGCSPVVHRGTEAQCSKTVWGGRSLVGRSSTQYPSSPTLTLSPQGQQLRQYGISASGTRDKEGFPRPLRTPGTPRFRPAADRTQGSVRKMGPTLAGPPHWPAKGSPMSRTLQDPGSPRPARSANPLADGQTPDRHPSPFGIPFSKLSQSKHLKARTGGGQWASDSKRRTPAPRDPKDP